ncbi:MAG: glycosyltransferase WbuB [Rhizobacter sp.]
MKIVLVSMNFTPELTGVGRYSGEMAAGLVERGHEVSVVCAPPYYPTWQVQSGYSGSAYRTEYPMPGLTVHRCPIWIPKRLGGLSRMLHLASFALASLPVVLKLVVWQPRVVFVVAPDLMCAPAAWLAARLSGAKAWLHIQDFELDAAFELGLLKQPLLRRFATWAERRLLLRFDTVSTISGRMMGLLAAKGVDARKAVFLPNWVDVSSIRHTDDAMALRSTLCIAESQVVCLYSGTLNRKSGVEVLVEAARRLIGDPRIMFVICGNGEMRAALEAQAQDMDNVRFLDLVPSSQVNALLNMADIHLLPQLRGAADLVLPSKLVGMLASDRPVIAAAAPGTEIASIVRDCGIVTEPECAQGFAQAIASLAIDPSRRDRLGAAGRAYAEAELDAKGVFQRLDDQLDKLDRPPEVPQALPNGRWAKLFSFFGGAETGSAGAVTAVSHRTR